MNPLFVGIDVSSRSNVAYLMKPDGSKHSSFSVQNNPGGVKVLSSRIVSALDGLHLSSVAIGLESTSIYGDHLVYALREDGNLGRFTPKIHVLNPKQVRKFKEAYSDLPKNDFVDAFGDTDVLILTDIYAAREKDVYNISSYKLMMAIKNKYPDREVYYVKDFDDIVNYIGKIAEQDDIVMTMGAGDVYKVGEMLLARNK